ncbi:MAG: PKD domain-containing protein [Chitinophagales bacterium]|nr:PKD domain-containing protein [Chitinophagales bacterium]
MKKLLAFMVALILCQPAFAQTPCGHTVNWTNISSGTNKVLKLDITNAQMSGVQKMHHSIYWGDGNSTNYGVYSTSNSVNHAYQSLGTYNVKLVVTVVDSTNQSLICADSTMIAVNMYSTNPCSVYISAVNDTSNNGNVTFSVSAPPSGSNVTYNWSFGDGSYGTGSSVTHTYTKYGQYYVTLYYSNGYCSATRNITVYPLNGCKGLGNMMTSTVNTSTLTASFMANSQLSLGWGKHMYYQWNFGDGSSTGSSMSNANISHTYSINGNYTVGLITTVVDTATNTVLCADTTARNVQVGSSNGIYGFVQRDTLLSPLSADYKIWLIKFDSATNNLYAVDSLSMSSIYERTYFAFTNKTAGKYRLKAAVTNNPTTGTVSIPTYSDSSLLWSNAYVVVHTQSTVQADIYMRKGVPVSGPGFIGGNVLQGANKGTSNGIQYVNVLLMDANDKVITYAVTDANGEYKFHSLPLGTYKVYPEDMGYATTPYVLDVNTGNPFIQSANFERSESKMTIKPLTTGISDVNRSNLTFKVSPNPAQDAVTIAWGKYSEEKANITITDISGKRAFRTEVNMNQNTLIKIDGLQTGFYFMNVTTDFGNTTQKLIVR